MPEGKRQLTPDGEFDSTHYVFSKLSKRFYSLGGPTGVGKDTLREKVLILHPGIETVMRVTTRPPRPYEAEGVDYHFVSEEKFADLKRRRRFWGVDNFAGNNYAVDGMLLLDALDGSHLVLMSGGISAVAIKQNYLPKMTNIFLSAPIAILEQRMKQRGDDLHTRRIRLEEAERQIAEEPELFDHIIDNCGSIAEGIEQLAQLMHLPRRPDFWK